MRVLLIGILAILLASAVQAREYTALGCIPGNPYGGTIGLSSLDTGGANYTVRNECGRGVVVAVKTTSQTNKCEMLVLQMGKDTTLDVVSYHKAPELEAACVDCTFADMRRKYPRDC